MDVKEEVVNYCPFKDVHGRSICSDADLDELGMCVHVIGFCTIDPNSQARKTLEPLEAATRRRKNLETGLFEEVETDFLRLNGSKREYVQEDKGDVLVNPEDPQTDFQSGNKHMNWKWFSWRVYNEHPENRVPELCPQPAKSIKNRVKHKSVEPEKSGSNKNVATAKK